MRLLDLGPAITQSPGVYCIENANGKMYIGSAANIHVRVRKHFALLYHGKHANSHLQSAYNKYGREAFRAYTLETCDRADLAAREARWFEALQPFGRGGYNIARDTECSSRNASAETRAKIGAAFKGRPLSAEHRAKMSLAHKGQPVAKGRRATPETRAKMSAINTGKTLSAEHRAKISASLAGHAVSMETRAKLAARSPQTVSAETRAKLRAIRLAYLRNPENKLKLSLAAKASAAHRRRSP